MPSPRRRIHFRFEDGSELRNAFSYDWLLWSIPEAVDILEETGFSEIVVYWERADEDGEPNGIYRSSRAGDLAPARIACVVAFR